MTGDEITLAVNLVRATFLPGSYDKRFAASLAAQASLDSEEPITPKQRSCLMQMVVRYRRQLPEDVVALARRLQLEDHADQLAPDGGSLGIMEAGAANAGTCGNHIAPLALPG